MRNWVIERESEGPVDHNLETLFTIGNGHISLRGTAVEQSRDELAGSFMHGIWDDMPVQRTELANLPRWWGIDIWANGQRLGIHGAAPSATWSLDLLTGTLTRRLVWQVDDLTAIEIEDQRFCCLDNPLGAAVRLQLKVTRGQADIRLRAGVDAHVDNTALKHWNVTCQFADDDTCGLEAKTIATGIDVGIAAIFDVPGAEISTCQADGQPAILAQATVAEGDSLTATKYVGFYGGPAGADPIGEATQTTADLARIGWDGLGASNRSEWQKVWAASDVEIDGDDEAQLAVRYYIFQLMIAAPRIADASIGAKTLSGFGYRHHVFWDTEVFMLPLFICTQPDLAARMLDYRWRRLAGARRKAAASGARGARFPWESAHTGDEVCPTWVENPADPANLIRIWTGDIELHLNADLAHACLQYWYATGDDEFMRRQGVEIILDTATYWATAAQLEDDGFYHFRDVIGPDEYHEHADDSAFTNAMATWHLRVATIMLSWLRQQYPADAKTLCRHLGIDDATEQLWATVSEKMAPANVCDGVIEQQEGFFDLEDVDFGLARDPARNCSMQAVYGIGPTAKTQNLKQPDVLMLAYMRPEMFDDASLRANYDYYDPRTDHELGSSLGPSISAIIAARVGEQDAAYAHFQRAMRADLHDVRGNGNDGIHGASAGGVWQAVVFGFAGLRIGPDGWSTAPHLPANWKRLKFNIIWRGVTQVIELAQP